MNYNSEKIKAIVLNSPENLEDMYERYASVLFQVYSTVAPNNFQEALKIANKQAKETP